MRMGDPKPQLLERFSLGTYATCIRLQQGFDEYKKPATLGRFRHWLINAFSFPGGMATS